MKILWYLMICNFFKGFILFELLLVLIMIFFVVSVMGYVILVMIRENIFFDVFSDLRFNIDRVIDFIVDEIR